MTVTKVGRTLEKAAIALMPDASAEELKRTAETVETPTPVGLDGSVTKWLLVSTRRL